MPTRKANREEQRCVHVVPLVPQMPFIFGACLCSFQETSPYPVSMGRYSITLQLFRHKHLRTESGHEVKPVFIIQGVSGAGSLEQGCTSLKNYKTLQGSSGLSGLGLQVCTTQKRWTGRCITLLPPNTPRPCPEQASTSREGLTGGGQNAGQILSLWCFPWFDF